MKYLTLFSEHTGYDEFTGTVDYLRPNVSHCIKENEVHYNPIINYRTRYLTLEPIVDENDSTQPSFTFTWKTNDTSHPVFPDGHFPQYSLDNGSTWTDFQNNVAVNCPADGKMLIRAEMNEYYDYGNSIWSYDEYPLPPFQIYSSTAYRVSGNLLSLAYGDDFANYDEITNTGLGFFLMFGADAVTYQTRGNKVYDASDLYLNFSWPSNYSSDYQYYKGFAYMFGSSDLVYAPKEISKNLVPYCCFHMFAACKNLQTTPELPATTLTSNCYRDMFFNCSGLTIAPELPATTLADECYRGMFKNCKNLITAPSILPATALSFSCYYEMFYDTKITTAPELPATTLANMCYYYMFYYCTYLTDAPELPATALTSECYGGMFQRCFSLTVAPELPATTLADKCYWWMFAGCTGLTTAPELPATTLVQNCYTGMFNNCSNLNYVKAMFTTEPSTAYTQNWVTGVASTGTFVKNSAAQWDVSGVNGIPTGWTIQTASS